MNELQFFNHVRTELGIAVEELKAAETYEDAEESKMFVLGMIHAFSTLADSMFIGKDTTQCDLIVIETNRDLFESLLEKAVSTSQPKEVISQIQNCLSSVLIDAMLYMQFATLQSIQQLLGGTNQNKRKDKSE